MRFQSDLPACCCALLLLVLLKSTVEGVQLGVQMGVIYFPSLYCWMTLSVQLINNSPSFVNQFGQRQLTLRGQGLSAISNTAATLNYYQSIDLSENELQALAGFSYLDRLRTLSANNNKIRFLYGLSHNLPALENLLLMANRIEDFAEIRSLAACKNLKRLVLIGNPVTERPNYRLFAVHHLRALTTLDFRKVTKQERQQAAKLYGKSAP